MNLSAITWKKFKKLLLANYFPDNVKRQMEKDLRSLYEREFARLLHCVLFVVQDDKDKACIF